MAHEVTRAEQAIDLARKDYYPDITVGLDYIDTGPARMAGVPDSGKDPVIASLSINVPIWWSKYAAGVREAESLRMSAIHARRERENMLAAEAQMVLYRLRDADRKIGLYRDTLVPMARQSMQAAEAAFRSNKANFVDLVDAERVLLEFELSHERALADHMQRFAELEMLVGADMAAGPEGQPGQDSAHPEGVSER
jgi:outer membrane protein TolC